MLRTGLRRAGFALPSLGRSLWVIAADGASIDAVYSLLDTVLERRPGHLMVLSVPADENLGHLVVRYEREVVLPLPLVSATARYARAINPALAVLLGPDGPWRARWQRRLAAIGLPVELLSPGGGGAVERLAAHLSLLAPTRELRESLRRPSSLARFVMGPVGRRALDVFAQKRIRNWAELAECLGRAERIVCLGNGPTSEDPALAAYAGDTLFRVKWRWRGRGVMTAPQLVFVGDPRTPARLDVPIYGFRSIADANYVLWRRSLVFHLPRFRFFIFDAMEDFPGSQGWRARPTNGAIMVATAAALRPKRLVIAGIDLYGHPDGRYPGGGGAHDGYNRVHDRNVEIEMIRQALSGFSGELRILSPRLSAALRVPAGSSSPAEAALGRRARP
jgi:hypothetical protein